MKIPILKKVKVIKKPSPLYGGEKSSGSTDWLITDKDAQQAALSRAKSFRGSGRRIPEFWLPDGQSRRVRFRHAGPLACIWAFNCKLRNGKFERYTSPPKGAVNLFSDELGLKPQFRAIYELVDLDGYKNRAGKVIKNMPSFWVVPHRTHEQLNVIATKRGGLHKMDIEITRCGSGAQTSYTFMTEAPSPMPLAVLKAEKLSDKLKEFFAPPSEKEQRGILGQVVSSQD